MNEHTGHDGACPFIDVMEVFGGKWRGTILFCLANQPKRFNELKNEIRNITQKVLSQELRALERDGLVSRVHHPEIPPKVVYSLTELGDTLKPIIELIDRWRSEHFHMVIQAQHRYDEASDE